MLAEFYTSFLRLSAWLAEFSLLMTLARGLVIISLLFATVAALEAVTGGNLRRYATQNFRTDLLYALVYHGGVYNAFVYVPLVAGLAFVVPAWDFQLIQQLPPFVGFVVFWLLTDAIGYWIHRWYHNSSFLWAFHRVHHAQTHLTFVTSFRNHIAEQLFSNLILFVPMKLLGFPLWYFAPLIFLQSLFEALQHSDLNWRFGRLYPILVSPAFHAIHHSPERHRHDSNYGKILSVWDYLFGTLSTGPRPERYGLVGADMPTSFSGTLAAPFVYLWQNHPIFFRRSRENSA